MGQFRRGVVATTLLAFVAGYALWPPGSVYWTSVADAIGAPATVGVVLVLAGAAGAVVARVTGATVGRIALGGAIAYAIGMALVESLLTPDSPVHFFLYAALLVCWLVGAVAVTLTPRRGAVTRP